MFMKNYCGSFVKVEPGFTPVPGPMPIPGPGGYPVMMPRPCVPVPLYPFPMDIDMRHYEPPPPPPPILDLSLKRPHRYLLSEPQVKKPCTDSLTLTIKKPRRDSNISTVSEDSNNEQGLDLTCPDKQNNSGKTFKKALLNRYSKCWFFFFNFIFMHVNWFNYLEIRQTFHSSPSHPKPHPTKSNRKSRSI